MPDPNYVSEIEREDGTLLTIKDAEARAAIDDMNPTLQQILSGVNDIKSSIGDVGEIIEEILVGPPTLIEKTITENGTYAAEDDDADGYSSVTVNVSGGSGSSGGDVVFYDYDGSVVTSYSAADFANLSAMPANPTHEGLTGQGWNWSLANAKAYVATYGRLNIGQMYTTSDGKTRLYFTVTKDDLFVVLELDLGSDTELDVDWGDGSEHTSWTSADGDGSKSHEYASAGRYVISIEVITGECYSLKGVSNIYKMEIGNGVTGISNNAFYEKLSLTSITIPDSVTSIGEYAFYSCYSLTSVTIPDGVTSIGDSTFYNCYSLSSVTIPDSVTSISGGPFYSCYSLTSITIPDGVTSIGDVTFYDCKSLTSITIPNGVTSIGYSAFSNCYALSSIKIPDSVTSIDSEAFYICFSLTSITIPDGVTSIPTDVFFDCNALSSITFESSTPPNLDSNLEIPYICIIRVPQGTLSTYTSAENYPDPEYYIYEEY